MNGQNQYKKISDWEILTPGGFKSFSGIKKVNKEYSIKIETELGKEIICSGGHQIYIKRETEFGEEESFMFADLVEPFFDKIKNSNDEFETIISVNKINANCELYDLVDVEDGRQYYANELLNHNCAHIENFTELWTGLQPTISTGGSAILISTPLGVGNQFHNIWVKATDKNFDGSKIKENEEGSNKFYAIELPWTVHPERDEDWYKDQCAELMNDPRRIAQELLCGFNASGNNFIENTILQKLKEKIKTPIARYGKNLDMNIWKYAVPGHNYVISADVARGDADDYSAFWVLDATDKEAVADFKGKIPPDRFAEFLIEIAEKYNKAFIVNEINSVGLATSTTLKALKYPNVYYNKLFKGSIVNDYSNVDVGDSFPGFDVNSKSRNEIITRLESFIRNQKIDLYSERLVKELDTFIWDGKKAKAMKGYNDDMVMSLAIGLEFIEYGQAAPETNDDPMAFILGMSRNSKTMNDLVNKNMSQQRTDSGWGTETGDVVGIRSSMSRPSSNNNPQNPFSNNFWSWVMK